MENKRLVITTLAAATACHLVAQSDSVWRVMDIEQVVVTATRTPKPLKDTPILTRLITAQDIRRTDATNIEDMLQQELPGVEFTYAMNQQVNMNLTGFAGQGVLFLVDGERLAGETMDNVDFTRLTMADVERVEIVKGSASALYGSNAAGGVVNVITRRAQEPFTLHLDGRYGEHNQQRYNLSSGMHRGIWSNRVTVSHTAMDNYEVHNRDNSPQTLTFGEVYGDKLWNVKDAVSLDLGQSLKLTGRVGYFYRTLTRVTDAPERYRDYTAGLKGVWTMSERDVLELSYSFDQYDKSDYQRLKRLDLRKYSNVQNNTRLLYIHTNRRGDVLTLGGDYMYDYLLNANLDEPHHQQTFDAFGQYDWSINEEWEMVSALRYDHFSGSDVSRLTPKLSVCYKALDNLKLRASYGMGFRAPTLKEKYYNFDMASIWIVEGTPDLRPETSHNVNLSAEYNRGAYSFNVGAYYNKVYDRITTGIPYYKPGDKQLYLNYVNLDKMDVYSLEASLQARWQNGVSAKLSYVLAHEDTAEAANQYMPARTHSLTASVDWFRQINKEIGLNLGLSGRCLSGIDNEEYVDLYDVQRGTVTLHYPGYSLLKLKASMRFKSFLQLNVTVDNLLNYKPDYYYYNAPLTTGINALVGVSIDID